MFHLNSQWFSRKSKYSKIGSSNCRPLWQKLQRLTLTVKSKLWGNGRDGKSRPESRNVSNTMIMALISTNWSFLFHSWIYYHTRAHSKGFFLVFLTHLFFRLFSSSYIFSYDFRMSEDWVSSYIVTQNLLGSILLLFCRPFHPSFDFTFWWLTFRWIWLLQRSKTFHWLMDWWLLIGWCENSSIR